MEKFELDKCTITFTQDDDMWVAHVEEWPDVITCGESKAEAAKNLFQDVLAIENMKQLNADIYSQELAREVAADVKAIMADLTNKKVNKLEEEIQFAFQILGCYPHCSHQELARVATNVAERWICSAFNESRLTEHGTDKYFFTLGEWLKQNGIPD